MFLLKIYKRDILNAKRNFGLDLVRSVAIGMVLMAHFGLEEKDTAGIKLGGLGVEIFFVLSGFLIGQILIKAFSKSLNAHSIFDFWIRRWFRTIPLYYLVLLYKFIFVDHTLGYKVFVYFIFLQNNFVGIDFMPITWSLVVEEWFYLTLPVFLFLFFYKRKITPASLLIFITGFILVVNVLRFVFVLNTESVFEGINGNFPFRLDSLMCGVLIASLKLKFETIYTKLSSFTLFLVFFILYLIQLYFFGKINLSGNLNDSIWARTLWFFTDSLLIAFCLPFIEQNLKIRSQTNVFKILITGISIFSYCAYLIHMEVYAHVIDSNVYTLKWAGECLAGVTLTFFISALIYSFYEKPMTDLREKFNRISKV